MSVTEKPGWYCARCETFQELTDEQVKAQKFGCAQPRNTFGTTAPCGGPLERKTMRIEQAEPTGEPSAHPYARLSALLDPDAIERALNRQIAKPRAELRNRFACAALATLKDEHYTRALDIAKRAYEIADAMLTEMDAPKTESKP